MMVTLTHDAQGHLQRYLRQLKAALRGHRSIDVNDVERDVLGHIDAELAGQPQPVSAATLRQVLDRLGTPDKWVPAEDMPPWRRTLSRLHAGPEDWRLAYLTFAFLVLAPVVGAVGPALAIASFPLARACVTLLAERGEPIGARGWLIYPPLIVWYVPLALVVLGWPLFPIVAGMEDPAVRRQLGVLLPPPLWATVPAIAGFALGVWWTVLGLLLARFTAAVHVTFRPFADTFERRHARRLALAGLVLLILAGSTAGALMLR